MNDSDIVTTIEKITPIVEQLFLQTDRIERDCKRIKGVLEAIHHVDNHFELQHVLKSITGRQRMFTRFIRQWIAIAERLDEYVTD